MGRKSASTVACAMGARSAVGHKKMATTIESCAAGLLLLGCCSRRASTTPSKDAGCGTSLRAARRSRVDERIMVIYVIVPSPR